MFRTMSYVGLACTAYNLHKIGKEILSQERNKLDKIQFRRSA